MPLPPAMLSAADQQKASCDADVRKLALALKGDIADGMDPTFLWYSISSQIVLRDPARVATTLAAAVLQLAQKPTSHPKGTVKREGDGFVGTCGCCGYTFDGTHHGVVRCLDKHMRTGWRP